MPWIRVAQPKRCSGAGSPAGSLYVYVVVTVERVDYYMYPLLPLCALVIGGAAARFVAFVRAADVASERALRAAGARPDRRRSSALLASRAPVARILSLQRSKPIATPSNSTARLPQNALVVIGHYGPDVQYYIDRFGWEEDPALWTPFDEESAIRKGARYFISIEDNRLRNNLELCAWLQRFPVLDRECGMARL